MNYQITNTLNPTNTDLLVNDLETDINKYCQINEYIYSIT